MEDLFRPKGVLPTPGVSVSQLFRVPGEPFHLSYGPGRALLGSSAMAFTPEGIVPSGIPLLGCSSPTTMRYTKRSLGGKNGLWGAKVAAFYSFLVMWIDSV